MKKAFIRLLLFCFSILFALGIVEIYLRSKSSKFEEISSVHDYAQFNVHYGIEPKPNLTYNEYGITVKTNKDATFGPEIIKKIPAIVHLGDSYTVGPGIEYKKNYPFLLTELINASSRVKFQTVILGMGGSSPLQQSYIYERKLRDVKPALTVYELYQNDLRDDYVFYYSTYMAAMKIYDQIPGWLIRTRIGQELFLFLTEKHGREYVKKYEDNSEVIAKNQKYVWNLTTKPGFEKILQISKARNSPLVIFYIPMGWEFDNEYAAGPAKKRDAWFTYVREWAKQHKVPFVDTYQALLSENTEELNELYLDGDHGYHLTEKGAEIVTNEIFKLIQSTKVLQ